VNPARWFAADSRREGTRIHELGLKDSIASIASKPRPCACGCGRTVQPDPQAPRLEYATQGCKNRAERRRRARVRPNRTAPAPTSIRVTGSGTLTAPGVLLSPPFPLYTVVAGPIALKAINGPTNSSTRAHPDVFNCNLQLCCHDKGHDFVASECGGGDPNQFAGNSGHAGTCSYGLHGAPYRRRLAIRRKTAALKP
jgi:hypothetical protein